jgi:benzodiazapine receptor
MDTFNWYQNLNKPAWAPPSWLFGPVWTILYILIAISFINIAAIVYRKEASAYLLLPIALNLIFNFSFTFFQFGLKNNILAAVDVLLVLGTLIWILVWVWPISRFSFYLLIPYLVWVAFATVLQLNIVYLNR